MDWYEILLIIVAIIFIGQFILQMFGFEFDIDGDFGMEFSDILSFKGILNFSLGFLIVLTVFDQVTWLTVFLGILTGVFLLICTGFTFHLVFKLEETKKYPDKLENVSATVYWFNPNTKRGEAIIIVNNASYFVPLYSLKEDLKRDDNIIVSGDLKQVNFVKFT